MKYYKVTAWHFEGDETHLEAGQTYKVYISTSGYPQIFHQSVIENSQGTLEFISYVDENGDNRGNWVPALKFYGGVDPQ